jgi:SAM-dependent methyltransferase
MRMSDLKEWFSEWFESPYYDLLYCKRDEDEAAFFLDNLLKYKKLKPNSTILDLPCGKGRHSIYLHQMGFSVVGADLSERSISHAKQFETEGLKFIVHDMRDPFVEAGFDLALNLFTSFGYFEGDEDNLKVLQSIHDSLNPDGVFVMDYLNGGKTERDLVPEEEVWVGDVHFHIHREILNGFILKNISITSPISKKKYQEKVRLFSQTEFEELFAKAKLKIERIAGDYSLQPFNADLSDRFIIIATKK